MPKEEEIEDAIEFLASANLTSDQAHCIDVIARAYEWEFSRAHTLKTQFDKIKSREKEKLKKIKSMVVEQMEVKSMLDELENDLEGLLRLRIDRGFESFDQEGKETASSGKATIEEMVVTEGSEAHHQVVAYCEANGYSLTSRSYQQV